MQSANKMCVALLFGGMSSEHEVSCVSVGNFVRNIDRSKYEVLTVGITKEGRWLYTEATAEQMADGSWEELPGNMACVISPDRADHGMILFTPDGRVEKMHLDVVIPVLHGLWGEDGTVQGLLELAGIAYVGCGVLASSVCMDKAVANALFEANGVPHTKWVAANRWEIEKDLEGVCAGVEQKLGWPVFVKPANAGSSVGISKVSNQEELKAAIALALENDRKVVFEAFVDGQEVECAVIGSDPAVATRPGEILAGAEFYTYDDKYKNGVSQTVIPAHLPEAKLDEVKTYAAMAYTALNCEGLARCDFFVEKNTGRVLINEINTFPGFTAISMYPISLRWHWKGRKSSMDNRPIGVFDSGLGGLTGVRELRKRLPHEDIIYFGDTGRVPYGSRSPETILQYARQDVAFLLSKNVKCIMAACGTVSSTYPAAEAAQLPVPYLGVVDAAAREAAFVTHNRRIGVIGTAATIRSRSYEKLLRQLVPGVEITARPCPLFVPLVEAGYVDHSEAGKQQITKLVIAQYLTEVREAGVDTLILGCTHYPLLKSMIGEFMGPGVTLVDPAMTAAHHLERMLAERGLRASHESGQAHFYVSDVPDSFVQTADLFLGEYKGGPVEQIAIDKY